MSANEFDPTIEDNKSNKCNRWSTDVKDLEDETVSILQKYGKTKPGRSRLRSRNTQPITRRLIQKKNQLSSSSKRLSHHHSYIKNIDITVVIKIQRWFRLIVSKNHRKYSVKYSSGNNEEVVKHYPKRSCALPRLFKEDGSVNLSLQTVIADALKTRRFDNVPAVLLREQLDNEEESRKYGQDSDQTLRSMKQNYLQILFSPEAKKFVAPITFQKATTTDQQNFRNCHLLEKKEENNSLHDDILVGSETNTMLQYSRGDNKIQKVCFNCWSAGKSNQCTLMDMIQNSLEEENLHVCDQWGIQFLRQCYRCEDIERHASTDLSALRFVKDRRRHSAIPEHNSHPIFKSLSKHIATVNFRSRRRLHVRQWFRSFISILKYHQIDSDHYVEAGKKLRELTTKANSFLLKCTSNRLRHRFSLAPITETDSSKYSVITYKRVLTERGMVNKKLMTPGPAPIPIQLYNKPQFYEIPPSVVMEIDHELEGINCYAHFGEKETQSCLVACGLSKQVILQHSIKQYFKPIYCDFTIKDRSVSVQSLTPESYIAPETFVVESIPQPYVVRELKHILDVRKPPTIMIKVGLSPNDKHYFGLNRPEETGEEEDCGFRTSEAAALPQLDTKIETKTFVPSKSILSPNTPKLLPRTKTQVDLTYPFCETKSIENSIKDLKYILEATRPCTHNKPQSFTIMTMQEPGHFMSKYNTSLPLGRLNSVVVRSWTFLQKRRIAKFYSKNGQIYWFDRRSGQTLWERPLIGEETLPVKAGGVLIGSRSNEYTDRMIDYNDNVKLRSLLRKVVLSQQHERNKRLWKKKRNNMALDSPMVSSGNQEKRGNNDCQFDNCFESNTVYIKHRLQQSYGDTNTREVEEVTESSIFPSTNLNSNHFFSNSNEKSSFDDILCKNMGNTSSIYLNNSSELGDINADRKKHEKELCAVGDESTSKIIVVDQLTCGKSDKEDEKKTANTKRLKSKSMNQPSSRLVSSITHALGGMLKDISNNDEDILKLGVGLGMSLSRQGILRFDDESVLDSGEDEMVASQYSDHCSTTSDSKYVGTDGQKEGYSSSTINEYLSPVKNDGSLRKTFDNFNSNHPNDTPVPKQYVTHALNNVDHSTNHHEDRNLVHSSLENFTDPLIAGFLDSINLRRVGKQHVHYIESMPNLPQCQPVGRVKPRSAGKDWVAIGFDPWSAGKDLLNVEFVPFLLQKEDAHDPIAPSVPKDAVCFVNAEQTDEVRLMKTRFEQLCSCVRHGEYPNFEQMMEEFEGELPIDFTDDVGNTLLMVACQNGSKRMVKLCLRKGSDLNKQNTNGHTCLHYTFGYGFNDLGVYLISKGADDSIANADGLTCYEGLRMEDISSF